MSWLPRLRTKITWLEKVSVFRGQTGLVLVLVLPGHESQDQHVDEHQTGKEEEESVGLETV